MSNDSLVLLLLLYQTLTSLTASMVGLSFQNRVASVKGPQPHKKDRVLAEGDDDEELGLPCLYSLPSSTKISGLQAVVIHTHKYVWSMFHNYLQYQVQIFHPVAELYRFVANLRFSSRMDSVVLLLFVLHNLSFEKSL